MKKIIATLLTTCCLTLAMGQSSKCGIDTRALLREEIAAGAETVSFLAKMIPGYSTALFERQGIVVGAQAGDIVSLRVPVDKVHLLDEWQEVLNYSIAHRVGGPTMDNARGDTRTEDVQMGRGVSNGQAYTGEGVYIGITDWGFDLTHPNYNNSGTDNHRVERIWDHYRKKGPAPEGFTYGTEITGYNKLLKAQSDTANLYGYGTHGTHVAGITAGRGTADEGLFRGQAPQARLLFCSFGLNETDWLDGVAWMKKVADADGKRLVINSSWGMYSFSCLDGKSLLSQAIDNFSKEGVVFCTSGGNNGDVDFHISRNFSQTPDTVKTAAAFYTYAEDAIGQCLILWGEPGYDFETYFRMAGKEAVWCGPKISTAAGDTIIYDTLDCNGTPVPYRIIAEHENPFDHRPHVQMDVNRAGNLQLQLFFAAPSGTVHAWNVANKSNHAGNEGASFFVGGNEGFVKGDHFYGIGEPGCAASTLTVAAHQADTWGRDSSEYNEGAIAYFSSFGPTFGEGAKPEISAPGYQVNSSLSIYSDTKYAPTASQTVGGLKYTWGQMSGTSMSCPAVTGVVALLLQANPNITTEQVRDILCATARNDSQTGPLHERDSISTTWGWGKVDALAAINEVLKSVGVNEVEEMNVPLRLYPNPARGQVLVHTGCGEQQQVEIYSVEGRRVLSLPINTEATIDVSMLRRGVYVVRVGSRAEKLIID